MNIQKKISTNYAKSLFEFILEKENKISNEISDSSIIFEPNNNFQKSETIFTVNQELLILKYFLLSSSKTFNLFNNPTINETEKESIFLELFPGLSPTLKSLLKILKEKKHYSFLPEISNEYNKLILKTKKITLVKLCIASPLESILASAIFDFLKKITEANTILLSFSYNPKLLAGLVIEYNSISLDGSLLKQFNNLFLEI